MTMRTGYVYFGCHQSHQKPDTQSSNPFPSAAINLLWLGWLEIAYYDSQ